MHEHESKHAGTHTQPTHPQGTDTCADERRLPHVCRHGPWPAWRSLDALYLLVVLLILADLWAEVVRCTDCRGGQLPGAVQDLGHAEVAQLEQPPR